MTTQVLAIANTAGGTAKSTTAHALAIAFSEYGKRTLLIDGDVKSSLSFQLGVEQTRHSLFDVLRENISLESALVNNSERFTFLPSDARLAHLVISDANEIVGTFRKNLEGLDNPFDIVVIDTPSTISPLLAIMLGCAEFAVAPFTPNLLSLRGILAAKKVSQSESLNRKQVHWLGALPILLHADPADLITLIQQDFSLLETSIPKSIEVIQAQSSGQSVLTTSPNNPVSIAYREISYFLLEQIRGL